MLKVAGLVPFTTIDFPTCLAAVVFFQGCPLRCPFCHNPNLQPYDDLTAMDWSEVVQFLTTRQKRLDGVVLSGGEPLMQENLLEAIHQIKDLGFKVAVHTSGIYPEKLKQILPLIDWIGLDVKAPSDKYSILTGRSNTWIPVLSSIRLIVNSGMDYEVRTTLDPRYLTISDVYKLADELTAENVTKYTLQKYRTFDQDKNPPMQSEVDSFFNDENLICFLKKTFPKFSCR